LNAIFFCSFASPRRRRGGMSERSDEIPESVCSFSFVPSNVARAPPARWEGSAKERSDCANPSRRGGMSERSDEIPESVCSFSFVPSNVARAPPARWEGSAKERSDCANSSIKKSPCIALQGDSIYKWSFSK